MKKILLIITLLAALMLPSAFINAATLKADAGTINMLPQEIGFMKILDNFKT